jgi:hypothetical protein
MLSVVYAECRKQKHYAVCRYVECRYAECHYAACHYAECQYAECHYAECCYADAIMLNVIMLNVIMLNVIMLNVIMLCVAMQSVLAPFSREDRTERERDRGRPEYLNKPVNPQSRKRPVRQKINDWNRFSFVVDSRDLGRPIL